MRLDARIAGEAVFYLVVLAASVRFVDLRDMTAVYAPATLDLLVHGGADLPFAHRILTPKAIGLLDAGTGLGIYRIAFLIEIACLFATVVVTCRLIALFIENPIYSKVAGFGVLIALAPSYVLIEYQNNWYPYDLPAVLLFTICLYFIFTSRDWMLLAIFPIAVLNRETAVFLIPIFFLVHAPVRLKRTLVLSVALLAIWLSIKLLLAALVSSQGGQTVYFGMFDNLRDLIGRPLDSLQLFSVFFFSWIPLILYYPRIPDPMVRRALLGSLAFVAANFIAANIHEVRVFGELAPLYWCAATLLFAGGLKLPGMKSPNGRYPKSQPHHVE